MNRKTRNRAISVLSRYHVAPNNFLDSCACTLNSRLILSPSPDNDFTRKLISGRGSCYVCHSFLNECTFAVNERQPELLRCTWIAVPRASVRHGERPLARDTFAPWYHRPPKNDQVRSFSPVGLRTRHFERKDKKGIVFSSGLLIRSRRNDGYRWLRRVLFDQKSQCLLLLHGL